MHGFVLLLFAVTAGFTASGIAANLYRLSGAKPGDRNAWFLRMAIMTVAGPSVIFESAIKGFVAKEWKPATFCLVIGAVAYWSLALGLFVLQLATAI